MASRQEWQPSAPLEQYEGTNVVVGTTWGDEGKGSDVDRMAERADVVVKTNGGDNAGHTISNEHGTYKLHHIPSGIFSPGAICIISDTFVINPITIVEEIEALQSSGVEINADKLLISSHAHLILPWHRMRDNLREVVRGGEKIGTTGRGIGPVHSDKSDRVGLRVQDLYDSHFEEIFDRECRLQEELTRAMYTVIRKDMRKGDSEKVFYDREEILKSLYEAREVLDPFVNNGKDIMMVIDDAQNAGKRILGESGQGILLDLDRGTYPYVTSSHPGLSGFLQATGIHPRDIERVLGVTKAFTTRVGSGPMPTELFDAMGDRLRGTGANFWDEFGATTGRARRCGWIDIPAIRYAVRVGGVDSLAFTKLDILDGLREVKICVGYEVGNSEYQTLPNAVDLDFMTRVTPMYETLAGWDSDSSGARSLQELHPNARKYVFRVQELIGKPIELVSVGPEREASIYV